MGLNLNEIKLVQSIYKQSMCVLELNKVGKS